MNKVKFYFSSDLKLAKQEVLLGPRNTVVATGEIVGNVTRIPRVTICGIFDPTKDTLSFGATRCATKDTFVKSIGRELAFERAMNNPYRVVYVPLNAKLSDVFMENCLEIESEIMSMVYPISFKK